MNNNYLMNQDFMSGGVYRAFIIKRSDSRVFIPGLCDKNILDSNGDISNEEFEKVKKTLPLALYNSPEIEKLLDDKPTPCFVAFENGNMKRPIVMAYFGKGVKSVPGSGGGTSGGSNIGNNGIYDSNGNIISLTGNGDLLIVAGHGNGDPGAGGNGYNEADLTRDFVNILSKKIKCDVYDTSKNMFKDLKGSEATSYLSKYKVVMEVHFNATAGAEGSEILVGNTDSPTSIEQAILKALTSTGLKNRGFRDGTWLGNYNKCKTAGVQDYFLIEVCFIDTSSDINHYINNKETIITNVANTFNTLIESSKNVDGTGAGGIVNSSTAIMGTSVATYTQMLKYLKSKNPSAPDYIQIYLNEGAAEGVRGDVAFAQSCLETGFWKFGGDVSADQNNFAGIGATGGGVKGNYFSTPQEGIRAQIQHLKAYASTQNLNNKCVDPRFDYVTRGSAITIGGLAGKWAASGGYNMSIVSVLNDILSQ